MSGEQTAFFLSFDYCIKSLHKTHRKNLWHDVYAYDELKVYQGTNVHINPQYSAKMFFAATHTSLTLFIHQRNATSWHERLDENLY
jgi:hypothetical protein